MEHESFSDQGVAELMNEAFVSIKVDREERPDLDDHFMTSAACSRERAAGLSPSS